MIVVAIWSWRVLREGLHRVSTQPLSNHEFREAILLHNEGVSFTQSDDQRQRTLATGFSPPVLYWTDAITTWAAQYDLDPNLIALIMQIESCGYANARSSAGAMGLFQVMPFHFQANENPYDPEVNAKRGLTYFAQALHIADGQLGLALAGYNGGHSVIDRDAAFWPEETRRYVSWGVGIYSEVTQGYSAPPTLQAWLHAGGDGLCQLAAHSQNPQASSEADLSLD